jgi:ubiquinone biosynthesis protein UbiJ
MIVTAPTHHFLNRILAEAHSSTPALSVLAGKHGVLHVCLMARNAFTTLTVVTAVAAQFTSHCVSVNLQKAVRAWAAGTVNIRFLLRKSENFPAAGWFHYQM